MQNSKYIAAPKRGFNQIEFEERLSKAQKIMLREGIDSIFVTTPSNIRYFTGFDSQFWESPTRPWFVVVPLDGKPVAVIPEIGAPEMAQTWLDDIRTWQAPNPKDDGLSLLKATLEEFSGRFGKIGAELGREMSIRMPVIDLLKLRETTSAEILDGSPAIWDMRINKTLAEIDHIQHICNITSDAFNELKNNIKIGDTERDVVNKLQIDILSRGGDASPYMPAISGPGGIAQIVCGPRDRVLEIGDILFIDTGSTYDGYFCDFDRNFAIGNISSEAEKVQDILWLATEAGINASVPGSTLEDIWLSINKIIEEGGSIGNNVGRMGHSFGLQLTEPPSVRLGDKSLISENMVLTIEPSMEYSPGKMIVHEENILVTKDGPKLLTKRSPREMPIIK